MGLAWSADHFNALLLHTCVAGVLTGMGFLTSSILLSDAYAQRYGYLTLASCGAFPSGAPTTVCLAVVMNDPRVGIASNIALWIWMPVEAERGYPTSNIVCAVSEFMTDEQPSTSRADGPCNCLMQG